MEIAYHLCYKLQNGFAYHKKKITKISSNVALTTSAQKKNKKNNHLKNTPNTIFSIKICLLN